ncbi:MAG: zinc ribbon domain-containing protein [Mollicutes bacterium]|nr:zinc ribbon domain-containing protein [Mollicutes bacterium]
MFCKYCGRKLEDDATFCSGCGKSVANENNNSVNNLNNSSSINLDNTINVNEVNTGSILENNNSLNEFSTSNNDSIGFGNSSIDLFNTSGVNDTNFSNNSVNSINQNINNNINSSVSSNSISNTNNSMNNNSNTSNIDITKSNNKVFILIGVFIAIIMIFAIICSVIGEDKIRNKNGNNNPVIEEKKTISYKGYKFNYPRGYKASIKDGVGIYLVGDVYAISIDIDNTNSYDSYLSLIKTTYPDQANDAELTISNRKFAGMVFESINKESICQYMSSTSNNTTFKGLIASKDKKFHADAFNTLASILDSSKVDSKSVTNQTDTLMLYGDSDINSFTYNQ